ncbi:hypothetical protein C5167_024270 [Papaver somniferum]|uniref:Uncharacterized protein n=1 Tax=Papaver somniferum TaxID=3469 RepID=A0A4Y7JS42_PAPSO|nr:hypothetical protein C5167_024270 [Papaver somniferum]
MARFVNKFMGKMEEYDKVLRVLGFGASGFMVYFVVHEQNRLERRLDEMQETRDTADEVFSQLSTVLQQAELARKEREKTFAFLKNISAAVHTSEK